MRRAVTQLLAVSLTIAASLEAESGSSPQPAARWQSPPPEVMAVLHAPQLPRVWTAPSGEHLLLADPVVYPPLTELAAPMHELAGIRVNPALNDIHGRPGATAPRLVAVEGGAEWRLPLPPDGEVLDASWTADARRFVLTVRHPDHIGVWVGSIEGGLGKIESLGVNQLMGPGVEWLPDQRDLDVPLREPRRTR